MQKLVHNFLTREQTYAEMMMAVVEEENRIEELKKKNEQVSEWLHTLNIGSEADAEDNQELVTLQKEYEELKIEDQDKRNKYYNVEIVDDMIQGWAKRVAPKVDDSFTPEKASDTDIVEIFEHISDKVCTLLEEFQEEPSAKTNMMNDFLTDDFVSKNIRIRPGSGRGNEEGKVHNSQNSWLKMDS